jgi:hypothetical protein
MHSVSARESGLAPIELARADSGDTCFRVAFESTEPVVASLVDSSGATLATSSEQDEGLLPPDGPVCIRKGNALRAAAEGAVGSRVRWVAFSAGP